MSAEPPAATASSCPFAIFYEGEAYSTAGKIMGRQAAGESFIAGVARTWPKGPMYAAGRSQPQALELGRQLRADGFSGQVRWTTLPDWQGVLDVGALYYPAPPERELAAARNLSFPAGFSLVGITHALSSTGVADRIADMLLPPFQPWDALICTSQAAKAFVSRMHDELRDYWREQTGATRFTDIQLPVIPLGINVSNYARPVATYATARRALGIPGSTTVFLFAGRLSFHAKANPAPLYQALEKAARTTEVACIEAGIFNNPQIREGFVEARKALAPSVRFIEVDGSQEPAYRQAWQAADVFVSLSDNIQETFGLTPVEAMAAGLPVLVSDWNGYRDTVRHGVDGYRIPTCTPPPGTAAEGAIRHSLGLDTYDRYIGATALATVVDPQLLEQAVLRLATDSALRTAMGSAGRARAEQEYDWPVVLRRYTELMTQLREVREKHASTPPRI